MGKDRVAESAQMLSEGNLDAFFWSGGLPTGSIVELAGSLSRKGKRLYLVPLPKESTSVQVLMRRFPGVVDTGVIPKSVYNTRYDTPTLTFWNVFVCPASLPEDVAYGMVKAVFENLSALHAAVAPARDTTLENAVRSRGGRIPYHEGAIRFSVRRGSGAERLPFRRVSPLSLLPPAPCAPPVPPRGRWGCPRGCKGFRLDLHLPAIQGLDFSF